jgi:hypothetical protein
MSVRDRAAATNLLWIVYQPNRGFQISLYFLNREAGWLRMRLTVLTLTAGCVLRKIYVCLNSPACACVSIKFASFIVNANYSIM